jgi:uncharacterized membrane protein YkoI
MYQRNKSSPGPRNHTCDIEPLEERWLLSGVMLPVDAAGERQSPVADLDQISPDDAAITTESPAEPHGAVEVVELAVAEEPDGDDAEIDTAALPREIITAFGDRFPGAELVEADLSNEDGVLEYDVNAEWNGQLIEVTFNADGEILGTERALATQELPLSVLDWVRQQFPGATIDEAGLLTEAGTESYELLITTSTQQAIEATLRVQGLDTQIPNGTPGPVGDRFDSAVTTTPLGRQRSDSGTDSAESQSPLESQPSANAESASEPRQSAEHVQTAEPSEARATETSGAEEETRENDSQSESSDQPAESLRSGGVASALVLPLADTAELITATIALGNGAAWLPQVAGVLTSVLPIDVAAIEQGLQAFLDEIDALAGEVAGETVTASSALRVAVIASLITGAELVLLDSRKPNRQPVVGSKSADSSWSWILGAAPRKPRK